jgi:triosephosphate isomerase
MKKLMAANWKMFKTVAEGVQTARELREEVQGDMPEDREVLVIPPAIMLEQVSAVLGGVPGMAVGAQNMYPAEQGAFTGEISPVQIKDCGCSYVLAGHSERRHVLGESDRFVGDKVRFGLQSGLRMILCIGETLEERRAGKVEEVLSRQLELGLKDIPVVDAERVVVAYEPVWAIGTGEVAGSEDIVATHGFVRNVLNRLVPGIADEVRILYGGSVKPDNCETIISLDNVDGVLVGGAGLEAQSFSRIVLA